MCDFSSVVKKVVETPPKYYIKDACPDQYVGKLEDITSNSIEFPCRVNMTTNSVPLELVVLVLESPHKKEFTQPFGPAKGTTGRLIRQFIKNIINDQVSLSRGLIILNAINNQCSLGEVTDKYRDTVFEEAWSSYAKNQFVERLYTLSISHDIFVINACTKGKKNKLRELVEKGVFEAIQRNSDIRITHPSSWASRSNRTAFW